MLSTLRPFASVVLGGALLVGCVTGLIGDAPGGPAPRDECAAETRTTGARLRRLTGDEYDRTVRALIGDTSQPSLSFPPDDKVNGYANNAVALEVTPLLAESIESAAARLSLVATNAFASLSPCLPRGNKEDDCAREFIASFGRRAFRRPLTDDEVNDVFAVYAAGKEGGDFYSGIQLTFEYFFQAPALLYKSELGDPSAAPGSATLLTGDEIATALSYLLTGAPPDDALVAAAQSGALAQADAREAHARRLLASPDARAQMTAFVFQWLGIDVDGAVKDASLYPEFDEGLRDSMKAETAAFVGDVIFDGEGTLRALFASSTSFVDERLGALYGLPSPPRALTRVALDPAQRSGILSHASVLSTYAQAAQSSPVRRGKMVRTRLFCQTLPSPPSDLMIVPPPPSDDSTTRGRFAAHTASPACQTCHVKMDPIGFGFEGYDAIGRYRTTENGFPIDAHGNVSGTRDADGDFDGLAQLADRLAASEDVRTCFVRNWVRYGLARTDEPEDACTIRADFAPFQRGAATVQELVVSFVRSRAFVTRTVAAAEGAP